MRVVNVAKMSKDTGISCVAIMRALGLQPKPCCIATIAEAKRAYYASPAGSEDEASVLNRWNKLAMVMVGNATTIAEAKEAYNASPENSEAQASAICKLATFFFEE